MRKKPQFISIIIAVLLALLTILVGILSSVASNNIPPLITPYLQYTWPVLGLATIGLVVLTVSQVVRQSSNEIESPLLKSQHRQQLLERQNRQRMIEKVRAFWIKGVLEQSLHGTALIELGLHEQPDAVENPWRLVIQEQDQSAHPLPPGTRIAQVFDDVGGELLILGEPGSGKTTILLELARDLLDRAQNEESYPIPVVFNLASWAVKRQPLSDWLVEEMNLKYQVPKKLGRSWVDSNQILPLLDGLDEVNSEYRDECLDAVNKYRVEHGIVPIAVCSRSADYLAQKRKVLLQSAVIVQPLTPQQIDNYLSSTGRQLAAVRVALRDDEDLREMAASPLMLSILSLAYYGKPIEDLLVANSSEIRRRQVFETYVQRMLQRRSVKPNYAPNQTIYWLSWLAQQMAQHNQTEFYIERMQPDWLSDNRSLQQPLNFIVGLVRLCVGVISVLVGWLISGLILGLIFGLLTKLIFGQLVGMVILLTTWRVVALVFVFMFGFNLILFIWVLYIGKSARKIKPLKIAIKLLKEWSSYVLIGLYIGVIGGLSLLQTIDSGYGLINDFFTQLGVGTLYGYLFGCALGTIIIILMPSWPPKIIKPVEVVNWSWMGMWQHLVSSLRDRINYMLIGPFIGLGGGLVIWLSGRQNDELVVWPLIGLGNRLIVWLLAGLVVGFGYAVIIWLAFGLVSGLIGGVSSERLDEHYLIKPNEGIWRSALNGVRAGLAFALIFGLIIMLILELIIPWEYGLIAGLILGFEAGWIIGGGFECVKHIILRFILWRDDSIPLNYPRFLDYAADRILLRKVGGGYIFVHRLLLEYFASLDDTPKPNKVADQAHDSTSTP